MISDSRALIWSLDHRRRAVAFVPAAAERSPEPAGSRVERFFRARRPPRGGLRRRRTPRRPRRRRHTARSVGRRGRRRGRARAPTRPGTRPSRSSVFRGSGRPRRRSERRGVRDAAPPGRPEERGGSSVRAGRGTRAARGSRSARSSRRAKRRPWRGPRGRDHGAAATPSPTAPAPAKSEPCGHTWKVEVRLSGFFLAAPCRCALLPN